MVMPLETSVWAGSCNALAVANAPSVPSAASQRQLTPTQVAQRSASLNLIQFSITVNKDEPFLHLQESPLDNSASEPTSRRFDWRRRGTKPNCESARGR